MLNDISYILFNKIIFVHITWHAFCSISGYLYWFSIGMLIGFFFSSKWRGEKERMVNAVFFYEGDRLVFNHWVSVRVERNLELLSIILILRGNRLFLPRLKLVIYISRGKIQFFFSKIIDLNGYFQLVLKSNYLDRIANIVNYRRRWNKD